MQLKITTVVTLAAGLIALFAVAQTPAGPVMSFAATTDNVGGSHEAIKIDILRWSTDAERDRLAKAWTQPNAPAAAPRNAGKGKGAIDFSDPAFADVGGGAAGGGGGRGKGKGGRGGDAAPAAPKTPETALNDAVGSAPIVGHMWTSEVAGYALHYALRVPSADGERILLIADRRLGAWNDMWKPAGTPTNYDFSLIELHVNSKGEGEGKVSITSKVAVEDASKSLALADYATAPVVLKSVKRRTN
jgi:hypothetical protein